jgi:hypothetical protein
MTCAEEWGCSGQRCGGGFRRPTVHLPDRHIEEGWADIVFPNSRALVLCLFADQFYGRWRCSSRLQTDVSGDVPPVVAGAVDDGLCMASRSCAGAPTACRECSALSGLAARGC